MANEGYGNFETDAPAPKPVHPDDWDTSQSAKPPSDAPGAGAAKADNPPPAAGPHADQNLTNHAATPGSGALPEGPAPGGDVDPGAG